MKKLWYKISYLGTPTAVDSQELQSAVLTNCISLIGALLMPMLGILYRLDLNFLNTELDKQKSESNKANELRNDKIKEATAKLLHSNNKLIKHNNEPEQFFYSVLRNLRELVAHLLGLIAVARTAATAALEKFGIKVLTFKSSYEAKLWLAQERIFLNGTNQTMGQGVLSLAQ